MKIFSFKNKVIERKYFFIFKKKLLNENIFLFSKKYY